ncbi:hypothetical protein DP49_5884 [Burkholderia pseudomallei]|nr:hypothetical protein DP49_5884 [Burkholderia pseudomallei]
MHGSVNMLQPYAPRNTQNSPWLVLGSIFHPMVWTLSSALRAFQHYARHADRHTTLLFRRPCILNSNLTSCFRISASPKIPGWVTIE